MVSFFHGYFSVFDSISLASTRSCFTSSYTRQPREPYGTVRRECLSVNPESKNSDQVLTTLYLLLCCPAYVSICANGSFRGHSGVKKTANCKGLVFWKIQFWLKQNYLVIWVIFRECFHLETQKEPGFSELGKLLSSADWNWMLGGKATPFEKEVFFTDLLEGW